MVTRYKLSTLKPLVLPLLQTVRYDFCDVSKIHWVILCPETELITWLIYFLNYLFWYSIRQYCINSSCCNVTESCSSCAIKVWPKLWNTLNIYLEYPQNTCKMEMDNSMTKPTKWHGWSESLLGAQVILLVLSCCGSNINFGSPRLALMQIYNMSHLMR